MSERERERERETGDIVFERQLITAELLHNRPYRTMSCASPAYLLHAPRDSI